MIVVDLFDMCGSDRAGCKKNARPAADGAVMDVTLM